MKSALAPERFFVVVPCRNCGQYIAECLDSLQAQTFTGWTALVADDASDDDTAARARAYESDPRIRVRTAPERLWLMGNTLDALRGLDLRPNDVVAVLDGDDFLRPACLERLWERHCRGFDLVYTDEDIQGQEHSIGRGLLPGVPVRDQLWTFSQLRSFKAYLFSLLDDALFRDASGGYYRAAGDLSLYLPMAELAGPDKVCFVDERLYYYRVHESCNFKVLRAEQLENNRRIRSQAALRRQARFFDVTEDVRGLEKPRLFEAARQFRDKHPWPLSVLVRHHIPASQADSWRAYHDLWIEDGVYLTGILEGG